MKVTRTIERREGGRVLFQFTQSIPVTTFAFVSSVIAGMRSLNLNHILRFHDLLPTITEILCLELSRLTSNRLLVNFLPKYLMVTFWRCKPDVRTEGIEGNVNFHTLGSPCSLSVLPECLKRTMLHMFGLHSGTLPFYNATHHDHLILVPRAQHFVA